jgi:hypothetical protein
LKNFDKEKQEKIGSELIKIYDQNSKNPKKKIQKVLQATGLGTRFF